MAKPRASLPKDVIDAIEGGNLIEAVKRLRKTGGIGLAEARSAVEAHVRSRSATPAAPTGHPDHAFGTRDDAGRVLPAVVLEALQRGDKVAAVRLLQERTGLGKNEARRRVEALGGTAALPSMPRLESSKAKTEAPLQPRAGGLAPGEVPRSNAGLWIVILMLAVLAAYFALR